MRYELIREIFNLCSNNQMRDVFVSEVETSDPEAVARTYCRGKDVTMDLSLIHILTLIPYFRRLK